MMDVVVPLRGVTLNLAFGPSCQQMRLVLLILQNKMDLALLPARPAHPLRQLVQEMHRAVVHDGVDRIEAQPVEMKLLQPVERVVDHELPHRRRISAIVVDRAPPGGLVTVREDLRGVNREIVPVGAEMIVDDVEKDHEALAMGGIHEGFQILRPAIARVRCK